VLNSDDKKYQGSGAVNPKLVKAEKIESHERDYSIEVTLPPLGVVVFELQGGKGAKKDSNK
jgi:1,4-alpha-glucan branching enzyme